LGRLSKGNHDGYTVASKFAFKIEDGKFVIDGTPKFIRKSCKSSLERLGVECVDLYYQHRSLWKRGR